MTPSPSLPSSIEYGALLCYQPRGNSKLAITSRQVRDGVKHDRFWVGGRHRVIDGAVTRMREHLGDLPFREMLGPEVVLVPAPRSSPLVKGGLWPGERICTALVEQGLGVQVRPLLVRTTAVNKAATSGRGERPGIHDHLESLRVDMDLDVPGAITVVDDFVTTGVTLLVAVALLREAYPEARIGAFALVRTVSEGEIPSILDPTLGTISRVGSDRTRREP